MQHCRILVSRITSNIPKSLQTFATVRSYPTLKPTTAKFTTMPPKAAKRKAPAADTGTTQTKKSRTQNGTSNGLRDPHPLAQKAEDHGIVLRKYYPPEMSTARTQAYNDGTIPRPIEELYSALEETAAERKKLGVKDAVVFWFKSDLRLDDNKGLATASQIAQEAGVPLICIYIVSPQDFEAHLTAPVRVDFILRTLQVVQQDLGKLDIPLHVETVEKRKQIPDRILQLMDDWGASHLYANMEYEVDELRREARMIHEMAENGKSFEITHDTCIVPPGELSSGSGRQYAVYSPWFKSWVAHVHSHLDLLEQYDAPDKNHSSARKAFKKLFDCPIPDAPKNKALTQAEKSRFHSLWPCGEYEAKKRLEKFCDERIGKYAKQRNIPSENGTSSLSVHLAAGTISARECVRTARGANKTKKLDAGIEGITSWISEVAWRDFYKHVLVNWPYVCMNKPYKSENSGITWLWDEDHFTAWCEGKTGFPIVDAAMRQLNHLGYMHNRCRMIVSSFLAKDLLIDWRHGEKYFMEHLIDGDFASNSGGWGFGASVGVDPQPYFRIFNPLRQSERFDPSGDYIRKWIPELAELDDREVHDPYERGAGQKAKKRGYPEPIVIHSEMRQKALSAYKEGAASGL